MLVLVLVAVVMGLVLLAAPSGVAVPATATVAPMLSVALDTISTVLRDVGQAVTTLGRAADAIGDSKPPSGVFVPKKGFWSNMPDPNFGVPRIPGAPDVDLLDPDPAERAIAPLVSLAVSAKLSRRARAAAPSAPPRPR